MRLLASLVLGSVVGAVAVLPAAGALTPQLADAFSKKVVIVQEEAASASTTPRTTSFTENELNAYLKFKAVDLLPIGLTEPVFTLLAEGHVNARAVIDLDIVRQKRSSGGWLDPTSYLSGTLPMTVIGVVHTGGGMARFDLERAEVSGVPVPKSLIQQVLAFYTKSAERPNGASLDDTFEMPARIQRLDVEMGRFLVTQ